MHSLVDQFQRHALESPDSVALISGDRSVSYGQLWQMVHAVAKKLTTSGLVAGDHVALWLENSAEYAAAIYAVWLTGAVAVPMNTGLRGDGLTSILNHSAAKFVVYDSSVRSAALPSVPDSLQALDVNGVKATENDISAAPGCDDPEQLAMLIYTSGTTGNPKGVMLSARNLAANTASITRYLALTDQDKTLCGLPFYYSYGNSLLHTHLSVGACLVLENSFLYPQKVMESMVNHQVTGFAGVPSTYELLLSRVDLTQFPMRSLRYATQAGGAMAPATIERLLQAWQNVKFFVMYGQTEATARLTYLPPDMLSKKLGSVGIAIPGVELSVQSPEGEALQTNAEGEVCARGDNIMLGYWQQSALTQQKIKHGWLHTGDIGRLDDDGYLYLVGRNSDMIKSGAHRIAPEEIEQVIKQIDDVEQVAVVGVPDALLGQSIKAFIVTKNNEPIEKRLIMATCKNQLAQYKWPKAIEFISDLPKTASGKVKRHELVN